MHTKRAAAGKGRDSVEQITVRVPQELVTRLDRLADALRLNRSQVVRLALESLVTQAAENGDVGRPPIEQVRDLLGTVDSGIPDLGQRHREYLLARLRRSSETAGARR